MPAVENLLVIDCKHMMQMKQIKMRTMEKATKETRGRRL